MEDRKRRPEPTPSTSNPGAGNDRPKNAEALGAFFADGLIIDVLYCVRSGKEADVYCCAAGASTGGESLAAKVYRPIEERSFRHDAMYQLGRDRSLGRRNIERARRERARAGLAIA